MRRRGFTLIELLSGITVMAMVVMGALALLITGLRSFNRTSSDVRLTQQNSQALRKISENLRQAITINITNGGKTITYSLPAVNATADPITGEQEFTSPPVADGVTRGYSVDFGAGVVRDSVSGKVIVKNVASVDPEVGSSQYNSAYTPFQLTTIGSYRAVTINLITRETVSNQSRWMRMKTTAIVRNSL